jgi:hypothetical protein
MYNYQSIEGFSLTVTGRQPGVAHIVDSGCRLVVYWLVCPSCKQRKLKSSLIENRPFGTGGYGGYYWLMKVSG